VVRQARKHGGSFLEVPLELFDFKLSFNFFPARPHGRPRFASTSRLGVFFAAIMTAGQNIGWKIGGRCRIHL